MEYNESHLKMSTVTSFMTEKGKHEPGEAYLGYIPVITEFCIPTSSGIRFQHPESVNKNIDGYNSNDQSRKYTQQVIENLKIDITDSDPNVGTTTIVLNLTDEPVTCFNQDAIPRILQPIKSKKLRELFSHYILVIKINRLTTPDFAARWYGKDENYLNHILNKNLAYNIDGENPDSKTNDYLNIINLANKLWKNVQNDNEEAKHNSIKVVTMGKISIDDFKDRRTNKQVSLYFKNIDMLFTIDRKIYLEEHPGLTKADIDISAFVDNVFPGTRFMYIIDRKNTIGDRYYNLADQVFVVPKIDIKKNLQPDGFYVAHLDENKDLKFDVEVRLEDINSVEYIYKTYEEAKTGADKLTHLKHEVEVTKLSLQNDGYIKKSDYEALLRANELDREQHKTDLEKLRQSYEERTLAVKNNHDVYGYKMKQHFDERKYVNDDKKYERDSFLETLKFGGAVLGVAGTMVLLMTKFGKS